MEVTRTLVVWCADWPVVAAGLPLDEPVIVLRANRVVACSPAARLEGVELHQRRRDAQSRCPEVVIVDHDPAAEARAFEPVAAALEALTPRIEIGYPGLCAFPTRGPSRYHGGDAALATRALGLVAAVLAGRGPARVGIADGPFAAELAARRRPRGRQPAPPSLPDQTTQPPTPPPPPSTGPTRGPTAPRRPGTAPVVIEPGGSPAFLAPIPVTVLADPGGPVGVELVDVLERLGIRTLGALAALPVAEVVGRFGAEGLLAHRLARGLDGRAPRTAPPPPEWTVVAELDPPAARVEAVAFVARGLADELQGKLSHRGSACTQLLIGAETEHGERHERVWRTEGRFTAISIAERVRWQIEGWLHAGAQRPTGGLIRLWLVPDEVVPAGGRQLVFTSAGPGAVDAVEAADRAARALARVQGMAGVEAVLVPERRGGRSPAERIVLVPAAAVDVTEPRPATQPSWVTEPWPGRVPDPAPAVVHDPPLPAEVLDADGRPVVVDGRGLIGSPPATVAVGDAAGGGNGGRRRRGRPSAVASYAGPWPCDERWWDSANHRRRARLQVLTTDGTAHLLVVESGRWAVEATYD